MNSLYSWPQLRCGDGGFNPVNRSLRFVNKRGALRYRYKDAQAENALCRMEIFIFKTRSECSAANDVSAG